MEHSWGRNISLYGLGGMGATLAARILVFPYTSILINNPFWLYGARAVFIPPDTAPDDPYVVYELPRFGGNFPYGWNVEPDVPL